MIFTFNRISLTEHTLLLNLAIASSQLLHLKKFFHSLLHLWKCLNIVGLLLELFETNFLLLYLLGKTSSYKNVSDLNFQFQVTKIIHQIRN